MANGQPQISFHGTWEQLKGTGKYLGVQGKGSYQGHYISQTDFAKLSLDQRIVVVNAMQRGFLSVAKRMVQAGCKAKGIALGKPEEAEEWATGPWGVVRQLRLIRESLAALKHSGDTPIGSVGRTIDGRLSVRLFPGNAIDGMLFKNVSAEVHMQAGVTEESLRCDSARFYRQPDHDGRVVLVLGAGNIAAIAPMDVITKMFNEGKVVLLRFIATAGRSTFAILTSTDGSVGVDGAGRNTLSSAARPGSCLRLPCRKPPIRQP